MVNSLDEAINKHSPFLSNKYTKWYMNIVSSECITGYTEKHHILPKCLFPEYKNCSWNIIKLSGRKHFIVHMLLPKMFNRNTASYGKMLTAGLRMKNGSSNQERYTNSRLYEIVSKKWAEYKTGKPASENQKRLVSMALKGIKKGPMKPEILARILETKRLTFVPKRLMNNGIVCKKVKYEDVDSLLSNGWKLGFLEKTEETKKICFEKLSNKAKKQWQKVKETGHSGHLIKV
jgi:hypothetical protein